LLTLARVGYARRWLRGAVLLVVWFAFGVAWWSVRGTADRPLVQGVAEEAVDGLRLTVFEQVGASARTVRCWADADAAVMGDTLVPVKARLLLTLMLDSTGHVPGPGERLLVRAHPERIDRLPDPGGFDQRAWASSFGVRLACFAPPGAWRTLSSAYGTSAFFARMRGRVSTWLERSGLPERERGLVKAVLLGIRDELSPDQKNAFARSGTMHVLAVSGSHVAIIYAALLFTFQWAGQRTAWRIIRSLLLLVLLWLYAGLTGFSPSVLRATITCSVVCLADMTPWRPEPVNSLFTAAFGLLLWDPLMLWQLGFQLSFLAVIGISFFYQPIHWAWVAPNRLLGYLWSLFAVSIAAQVFTAPLALLWFQAFPTWFLPANLLVVALVTLAVYGGTALVLLHWVPMLGALLSVAMTWLLVALGWSADLFAGLPYSYPGVRVDALQCVALYVAVLALAAWLFERWRWSLSVLLGAVLVIAVDWGVNAQQRNAQLRLVVYDDRAQLSVAVEHGRTILVFGDSTDAWMARKVEQHARGIGATAVHWGAGLPTAIGTGRAAYRVLDLSVDTARIAAGAVRTVVLHGRGRLHPDALHRRLAPRDGYILAPDMSGRARRAMQAWCHDHGVPVHDVKADGAYVR
jgi:competence protein ComEC